jgi:hypothetical protein
MHIYARTELIDPSQPDEALAAAVEVPKIVKDITGIDVAVWTTLFGQRLGTVAWSFRIDSQSALGEVTDTVIADPRYQKFLKKNRGFFSGLPEDSLVEVISSVGTPTVGAYVTIITAQCAAGKISDAMAWGVETMQYAAKLTGTSPMMGRSLYGPFAQLGWITNFDSLAQIDAFEKATSSDPGYIDRLDHGGKLFQPETVTSRLSRRLA